MLAQYDGVDAAAAREHLAYFIRAVAPVAEEAGILLAIHPDDPPVPLLGLPRVVSTAEDLRFILDASDSPANGLCFCAGSLASRAGQGRTRERNSQLQRLLSRPFSTRFG